MMTTPDDSHTGDLTSLARQYAQANGNAARLALGMRLGSALAELAAVNAIAMAAQGKDLVSRGRIPDLHRAVLAG